MIVNILYLCSYASICVCVCHEKLAVYRTFLQIGSTPEELLGIPKPGVSPLAGAASEPAASSQLCLKIVYLASGNLT